MLELSLEPVSEPGPRSIIYAALDELARRYGPGADAAQLDPEEMEPPRGAFLVARDAGHLVGGVGLRSIALTPRRVGEVKRLWVRPDRRRQGVAQALMTRLVDVARELGFAELFLETGHAQPEALAFYRATGWARVNALPEGAFSYPEAARFFLAL